MSPLRGEEFTGRTVEEAIERGLRALGRKRGDVDIEVLEKGKPANVLGMGGEDARVLLSFQEDERPAEPEPIIDEAEVPRRPDAVRATREEEGDEATPAFAEELALGAGVLRDLLEAMGVEAEVALDDRPGLEGVDVLGTELGALIGRGGENLVALQQIVSAITSKRVGRSVHVPVDIEGYRRRREDQLREIAQRVASRVRASGQAVTLEPMLAYERRIVHLSVQGQQGLKTESVGMEPNRRVVISSTAPGARGPLREGGPVGGGFRPRPAGPGGPGGPGAGGYGPRRGYGPRPGGGYRPRPDRSP
jgi:spoIIIJ-associated protein